MGKWLQIQTSGEYFVCVLSKLRSSGGETPGELGHEKMDDVRVTGTFSAWQQGLEGPNLRAVSMGIFPPWLMKVKLFSPKGHVASSVLNTRGLLLHVNKNVWVCGFGVY